MMVTNRQLQEQVNDTVIQAVRAGRVPWRSDHGFPTNILSRRRFDGLAALLLMTAADRHGFTSCYWGTKDEWELLGGKIKDGHGTQIVVGTRACTVYNLCQIDGDFPISRSLRPIVDYAVVDCIIANTRADIRFSDERIAEFHFDGDFVKICRKEHFERGVGGVPAYYQALMHELAHWTQSRCGWWGKPEANELRAEMAADFLTTELGIPGIPSQCRENIRKYTEPWVRAMIRDPRLIFKVAASADKAVDYTLGFTFRVEPRHKLVEVEVA
jgi:antirestriction protein ArdC